MDCVLIELSLYKFKIALTFDEKLVLFLCSFKKYSEKHTSNLLNVKIRRIKYLKESLKIKKEKDLVGIYIRINSQDTKEILYLGIECANRKTELISLDSELNKDKFLNDKLTNEIEEIEY